MFLHTFRFALALLAAVLATNASAAEGVSGPYTATVERVVDGDTIAVRVTVWLELDLRVLVRVRGIDAPELRGRCEFEKKRAAAAMGALGQLVAAGPLTLTNIEGDKYFGRVVADVASAKGADVAAAMVAGGFARPYSGGTGGGWCEISARDPGPDRVAQAAAGR
jgi:endonuclease YncB( thermonuclease family)